MRADGSAMTTADGSDLEANARYRSTSVDPILLDCHAPKRRRNTRQMAEHDELRSVLSMKF
jgi:hypothetical protein